MSAPQGNGRASSSGTGTSGSTGAKCSAHGGASRSGRSCRRWRRVRAAEHVAVVVADLAEGSLVDDRVLAIPAGALLAPVRDHREAPELDALDGAPGLGGPLEERHPVEPRVLEGLEEAVLPHRAGDAPRPQLRVALEVVGHVLVADDVGDDGAAAAGRGSGGSPGRASPRPGGGPGSRTQSETTTSTDPSGTSGATCRSRSASASGVGASIRPGGSGSRSQGAVHPIVRMRWPGARPPSRPTMA
jgi:hypothetical protein